MYTWRYADAEKYMERIRAGLPPVMICVACNGGIQGKEYHEGIPETPEEIAESVAEAAACGASMVHVHARAPGNLTAGARTTADWLTTIDAIRDRCPDIVINASTGGDLTMSMEERLACLDAGPDVASLNLTPDMSRFRLKARLAPLPHPRPAMEYDECVPFTYGLIEKFAREMQRRNIKPELEIYHTGGSWVIRDLIEQKLIDPPYLIQTVMGVQTASYPTPDNLLQLLRDLPDGSLWLCSGIGPFQLPMTTMALVMGGHVRVGLEDNLYFARGQKFRSNAEAVTRVASLARLLQREVATPAQVRSMLNLKPVTRGSRA